MQNARLWKFAASLFTVERQDGISAISKLLIWSLRFQWEQLACACTSLALQLFIVLSRPAHVINATHTQITRTQATLFESAAAGSSSSWKQRRRGWCTTLSAPTSSAWIRELVAYARAFAIKGIYSSPYFGWKHAIGEIKNKFKIKGFSTRC